MAKKVLLVDDEKQTATVFQTGLASSGYEVTVAENGKQALDAVKAEKFDVIVLDQMMPDMSGNDVLRALKSDELTKNIPVAILTNFGHDTIVKEALNLGANDYILKYQIEPADLAERIKRLVGE